MSKKEYYARTLGFVDYANNNDIFHKPIKGESCDFGALGWAWQGFVGLALGCTGGVLGHKELYQDSQVDFQCGGLRIEVKQNCTMLDIFYGHRKPVDFVVYCPNFNRELASDLVNGNCTLDEIAYVMTGDDFKSALEKAGLVRYGKLDSNGCSHTAMQSYKNSKKKSLLWLDCLDEVDTMTMTELRALVDEKRAERRESRRGEA